MYVGEVLTLEVRLKNSTTPPTNVLWTISGTRLKDYDPDKATDQVSELQDADRTKTTIEFHWVSGGDQTIEVICDGAPQRAQVTVHVLRPTISVIATSDGTIKQDVTGNPLTTGTFFNEMPNDLGGQRFQILNIGGWIYFEATQDGNVVGDIGWLQVINYTTNTQTLTDGSTIGWNLHGLDGQSSYPGRNNYTVDGPQSRVVRPNKEKLEYSAALTMYCMYKSFVAGAKWVPIRSTDWDFTYKTHCYDITNPPHNQDNWQMDQLDLSFNPPDAECMTSPTWDNVVPVNPPLE